MVIESSHSACNGTVMTQPSSSEMQVVASANSDTKKREAEQLKEQANVFFKGKLTNFLTLN